MTYVEDMNHNYCHLEVYAKENSKATGALKVLELLNIDIKDSYALVMEIMILRFYLQWEWVWQWQMAV